MAWTGENLTNAVAVKNWDLWTRNRANGFITYFRNAGEPQEWQVGEWGDTKAESIRATQDLIVATLNGAAWTL